MNLIDKKNINSQIGKSSFWMPRKIVGLCEYIAGIEEIDEIIGKQNFFKINPVINFLIHKEGLEISIVHNFKLRYIALKNSEIQNVILEKGNIIDTQNRSVIGRAIVGNLLFGQTGAIIGAMSGTMKDIVKENDKLVIMLNVEDKEQAFLFEIKKGKTIEVSKFFKENYQRIFSING